MGETVTTGLETLTNAFAWISCLTAINYTGSYS